MYYLCANVIKPLTEPDQLSYAEFVGPQDTIWFVSHYWGFPFRHFVDCIDKQAKSAAGCADWQSLTYWVCTLSNNQWRVQEEMGSNCEDSSFHLALKSATCSGTVMVLDECALPLTRSWCLFEVLTTLRLTQERSSDDFRGLLLSTATGVLNEGHASVDVAMGLAHRLASLRLEDAVASNVEDKEMIDNKVRSMEGGFLAVNTFVRSQIKNAILTTKDSFEMDFQGVVRVLGEDDGTNTLST